MADQYTRSLFGMLRANNLARYTMYPVTATGQCAGVALPHDNNLVAGNWGAWTQILLAAAAPATEYWYCGFQILISGAAGVQQHSVQIGTGLVAGPPVAIHDGSNAPGRAAAAEDSTIFTPVLVPYPIYEPAATPISGQSAVTAKAAATNITVGVLLATGL
jgi:hypothetical protein